MASLVAVFKLQGLEMLLRRLKHQRQCERSMYKQVAVALDISGVRGIEVQEVGVICDGRVPEEESSGRRKRVCKVWFDRS